MKFRIKVEENQGSGDDTALNEIELECKYINSTKDGIIINGAKGMWGFWSEYLECPIHQGFIGFQLKVEGDQGSNDDTSANGLKVFCQNDSISLTPENTASWGQWTEAIFCPNETIICGLRVQIQPNQGGNNDNTALNNVDFRCCPFSKKVI